MTWFANTGAALGRAFETSIYWLDAFKAGVYELSQFVSTGEHNSFTDWASSWGVNLVALRDGVIGLYEQVETIFKGGEDSSWVKTLTTKLQNFTIALQEMFVQLSEMLEGVQRFAYGYQKWSDAPLWRKLTLTAFEGQGMMIQGAAKATWNAGQATLVGAGAGMDLVTKSTSNAVSDYQLYGNSRGGYNSPIVNDMGRMSPEQYATATRRQDFQAVSSPVQSHVVKLEVTGNAEMISALMDEKTRTQLPILLSSEIAKAVVGAPKRD